MIDHNNLLNNIIINSHNIHLSPIKNNNNNDNDNENNYYRY